MSIREYRFLLSERATLEKLIERTHPESVISRMSLEDRLSEVEEEINAHGERYSTQPIDARLTFRGKPVVGSYGIQADFGPDAVKSFANAVALVGAGQHSKLGARGVIPNRENYQLLITGTVRGSFGFQLEDASQQGVFGPDMDPIEMAIGRVKDILEASVRSDDELTETLAESDERAVAAVHDFLEVVAEQEAVCALEFKGDVFAFRDTNQVRRSESRLRQDNIREEDVTFMGHFQGFLPHSHRAEFLVERADQDFLSNVVGQVINAKVERLVDDSVSINEILNSDVRISARFRKVGSGNPTYLITSCNRIA